MRILASDLPSGGISVYQLKNDLMFERKLLFGCMGKQNYAQKFCEFVQDGKQYLVVGRKGLSIQIYDVNDNFKLVSTKQLMTNPNVADFFVNINVINGEIKACTGLGYCYFLKASVLISSCYNDFSMSFGLCGPISFLKFLSEQDGDLVILGGKDREITLLDVDSHLTIWKSKNSKKIDKLYQPYIQKDPVWIQDVAVLEYVENVEVKFIAATRFGKLLFYNTQVSRLPIDEIEISENPIKHLHILGDLLLIADSFDNVILFDYKNQKVVNKFEMKTGAVSSMNFIEFDSGNNETGNESRKNFLAFVTSYADKCLRLYKIQDGYKTLVSGIFLDTGASPEICIIEKDRIPEALKQDLTPNKRIRPMR